MGDGAAAKDDEKEQPQQLQANEQAGLPKETQSQAYDRNSPRGPE